VATLRIPDEALAKLQAAAAARHMSLEDYLIDIAAKAARQPRTPSAQFAKRNVAERAAAEDSIRKLAGEIKNKATIEELIADKHAGHRY
jgi:hypothetical protein